MTHPPASLTPLSQGYASLLTDIKQRVRQAQVRAMLSVNAELIRLYWGIGQMIHERQQQEGWGAGVIPRLARDLHNELPEEKGFSERNIKQMLAFYREYAQLSFVQQPAAQIEVKQKMPQAAALFTAELILALPWTHHAVLMAKVKDHATRSWYMQAALEHGWSRNILLMQIETAAHQRHGQAASNFALRLPKPESDLVQQTLKDPYLFDFLTLSDPFHERELETGLIAHLEKFLLELGQGFAFVGRQYHLDIGDQDFYIDLLFYNRRLKRLVAIELKLGEFKAADKGQMELYLRWLAKHEQEPGEAPPLGIILCTGKNRERIELLELDQSGIHVAEYLTGLPPRQLLEQKLHEAVARSRARLENRSGADEEGAV